MQLLSNRQCAAFIHRYDHPDNIYNKNAYFLQSTIKSINWRNLRKESTNFVTKLNRRMNNDIPAYLTLSVQDIANISK